MRTSGAGRLSLMKELVKTLMEEVPPITVNLSLVACLRQAARGACDGASYHSRLHQPGSTLPRPTSWQRLRAA